MANQLPGQWESTVLVLHSFTAHQDPLVNYLMQGIKDLMQ